MIVENSQSFSAPLIHSQLFTRPVQAVRITSVVAQIAHRMSLSRRISSPARWLWLNRVSTELRKDHC